MNNDASDRGSRGAGDPREEAERAERLSREDRFEDSLAHSWDPTDAAVDRRLRSLIGPIIPLHAPLYGFERVLVRAQRRRDRALFVGLAAGFTAVAVAAGGVVAGTRSGGSTVQTAACDTASRSAAGASREGTGFGYGLG
ncbi:hypothetical protein KGA66_05465, partial [Actinocrinis puniceicyclus]